MESLSIILQLHTPEELILYSNIAHWVFGAIFLIVSGIALMQALGYWKSRPYLWPMLVLIAGLFLPVFSFFHHWNELGFVWQAMIGDPQQRQHLIMAILLGIAGIFELKSKRKLVFPAVLVIIGIMFIVHPQHGAGEAVMRASIIHQYLGVILILTGISRSAEMLWPKRKWLAYPWIFFLAIAAILLISYREPANAYQLDSLQTLFYDTL